MVKVSGEKVKNKIAICMKVNMPMIKSVDMEFSLGRRETFTLENTKMMKEMDMAKWFGLMGQCIKENGSEAFSMVMVK